MPLDGALNLMGWRGLDQAWAHVRYVAETGHLWLTTRLGGFWVLELEPQVRSTLDLPEVTAAWPDGRPPRPDGGAAVVAGSLGATGIYCTLGTV